MTLTASGAAARELRRADVALRAAGGLRTSTLVDGSTRLSFRADSRSLSRGVATLGLAGELRLTRGGRAVRFGMLRVRVTGMAVSISGTSGGTRRTLLTGKPAGKALTLDASTRGVALKPTSLRFTAATARLVRTRLGLRRAPTGSFGPAAVSAGVKHPAGSGGTGSGTPTTGPITTAPPAVLRPASAVDVVGGTIVWRIRESFIRYINAGEGTSVRDGAIADPPEALADAGNVPLVYQFRFPFSAGWSDAPSGTATVGFTGGVRFRYSAHTIDFTTATPEIELNGAASRATFTLSGTDGTAFGGKRAVLLDLDPSKAKSRTTSPDGKTVTYEQIPATVPATAGDSVFAGFYLAGAPFGWVSLSYTVA
ncbi:MAG: HtaA domain-containing protein [Solirubrobacteraceae bacterium]|nr:HtaA domain-containing protein [Solirubrobacteraceae bacterium]